MSGEWMSVEKRTAAPTDPSSPLIVRTHTPIDRSDSVNPTLRGPFAKSCHDDLHRIRLKKASGVVGREPAGDSVVSPPG